MAETAGTIASVATAIGVLLAVYQLRLSRRSSVSQFEMRFVDRYEMLLRALPADVVLELREIDSPDHDELRVFHDYFALCDEEIFYRQEGRISRATWSDWERGMQLNMQRATYATAWKRLLENERLDERFSGLEDRMERLIAKKSFDPYIGPVGRWRRRGEQQ